MTNRSHGFLFIQIILLLAVFHCADAQTDDNFLYSSPQTQVFLKKALPPGLSENEFDRLYKGLKKGLEEIEKIYQFKVDPGGVFKSIYDQNSLLNSMSEGAITDLPVPFLGGAIGGALKYRDKEYEQRIQPFITERLFGQNSSLNSFFTQIRQTCNNDLSCIEQAAKDISEDPDIRRLLSENPGIIDEAKLKEMIAASSANAEANHGETIEQFNSQAEFMTAFATSVQTQLTQVVANQATLINNTATIIQTQQEHTIALAQIQATIDANQQELRQRLEQGFGEVISLQQQNIFLTEMVLEHTVAINEKLDNALIMLGDIGDDVDKIRERQLTQIFNESSLSQKLKLLEGPDGSELISDVAKRAAMIENVRIMIRQQQIVAVTKKVREWGLVSLEALNTFYPDCPPEIKRVVSVAITASDIVGSITTGNWSQAIMAGLSLFKSPQPGPEMLMLQRINEQLTSLESNMNAQFREVHEHLFTIEENLAARLEIVNQKLDIISQQIEFTYTELSEQLLTVDNKLSYVVKQNDCTEDLILDIFRSNNSDICERPVKEFKKRVSEGLINSLEDLEKFFIGQQCKNCIEALFNNSAQNLLNSQLFRYSYCNIASSTENNRPDNVYDFIFNQLVPDSIKGDPYWLFSIMLFPDNISSAASMMDSIRAMPDTLRQKIRNTYAHFTLSETDHHYRHYMAVIELADYVITMMPFLELYNDGGLMKHEQIMANPEITRERSKKIISFLNNLSDLIEHTIFQQSLMAGMASFKTVDKMMFSGDVTDASGMTLTELFTYNPPFNKNYSAYFIDKKYGGLGNVSRIIRNQPFTSIGKYYQGNNKYESLVAKDQYGNILLSTNWSTSNGKKPIFQCFMPGITGTGTDTLIYENSLRTAIPRSVPALMSIKKQIDLLSAEMNFVISDALDKQGAPLSRKDLDIILQIQKTP